MKKYILSSIILLLAAANTAWGQTNVAKIGTTEYATLAEALNAARDAAAGGWNTTSVTVEIINDITFDPSDSWTPILYDRLNPITINGNYHTITNLPGMLYAKDGSGVSSLTINNLTFERPTVSLTTNYAAVIMGYADCVEGLYFNNVTINNASVTGAKYAAAFVGYAAGYNNQNDGPLFQNIVFNNCTVTNSTITSTGGGSVGALMGHAAGNKDARIEVKTTTVSGNTISTTDSNKAGALFGTVGNAQATTNHPESGLFVSANVSNNTVTAIDTPITTIYGRRGSEGELTLTEGGSYNSNPIETGQSWISIEEDCTLRENSDHTYGVSAVNPVAIIGETGYKTLEKAIADAQPGQTIKLLTNVELDEAVDINESITLDLDGNTISISAANQDGYAISVSSGTVTITGNGTIDAGDYVALNVTGGAVTIDNGTFVGMVGVEDGSLEITNGTFGTLTTSGGTTTVNGGTFSETVQVGGGSLTINGGIFTAEGNVLQAMDGGIITVTGGSFTATQSGEGSPIVALADQDGLIQISGGTFTGGPLGVTDGTNGEIEVSGGTFSSDVQDYCVEGYQSKDNGNGTYSVEELPDVAKIGTTNYKSLAAAFAAANAATSATTITLLANTTESETINLNPSKTVTLDLAGYTITSDLSTLTPLFKLTKGSLTVKDSGTTKGGITGSGMIFRIDSRESGVTAASQATITVNSGVNVTSTDSPCAFIRGYATFTTSGNLTSSGEYATIQGNGSDTQGSKITVNGGTVKSNNSNAIYHPQKGELTIQNGSTVEGYKSGIAIKAGTLSVNGGTIRATGPSNIPTSGWSNGVNASGCAIQIESNTDYDANGVKVTIGGTSGGPTIESANGAAIYEYIGKGDATNLTQLKITKGTLTSAAGQEAILLSEEAANANVTAVSGGSFSSVVPAAYCADGYEPVTTADANGMYTVQVASESAVASITNANGTSYYLKVTDALSAAQNGETLVMLKDYTYSGSQSVSAAQLTAQKTITLDLGGHTLEHTNGGQALYVRGSSGKIPNITIKNGTIKSNTTAIAAGSYAVVTIEDDVTVIGNRGIEVGGGQTTLTTEGTITATEAGIFVAGAGTSYANKIVNVNGGTISGEYGIYSSQAATVNVSDGNITGTTAAIALNGYQPYSPTSSYTIKLNVTGGTISGTGDGSAIAGSGNLNDGNYEINISDGTISADNCAIYHCNDGVLTVSGGTITGSTAIYQKSGTMNISGGTITGNGAATAYSYNGNGANPTGDAVVIDNCNYPGGAPSASITGGTFISTNAQPIGSYAYGDGNDPITGFVTGGKFNKSIPDEYCDQTQGFSCPDTPNTNDGMYQVVTTAVASITSGGTTAYYASLAEAVGAAQAGDVITMIADDNVSLTNGGEIEINKAITITGAVDADGKPLYTIYGTPNNSGYNDIFVKSTTGTVTISNVKLDSFGNQLTSKMGHSPICVSGSNNDVVIDNVYISNINCEGIHVNGGSFEITNCNIDCSKTSERIYTKGICIVNAATGSITNTTITGVDCYDPDDLSAAIELQGSGDITISNCNLTSKTIGISATYVRVDGTVQNDQPGTSNVAVSGCTINGEQYALYGNGYGKEGDGALITVTSGTYNGKVEGKIGNSSPGVSISGGTYDAQVPMEYLADTYICPSTTNNDGRYYIEQGEYVAKIADLLNGVNYGYETLAAAVAAAGADDEIILLDDITLDANITCNLEDGEALAITFGTFDITKGNFSVSLPSGVTVVTDKQTDIFSALAATDHIIETYDATIPQYSYTAGVAVASITTGSTTKYYATLADAFEDVATGQTINMLTDVTLTAPMNLELGTKAVSLDLGGNTLTGRTNLKNGNLTIKNGTVAGGSEQALNVYGSATADTQNYSVLTIASNVNVTADVYGVCLFGPTFNSNQGYGAVINIYGTVTTTGDEKNGAVFVSGNLGQNIDGDMKNVINVYGTITSATDAAIALNGNATVNVKDGATITGNTAIAIKRGTLNVEGGTVHATGLGNIPTAGNNNGTEMTGAAVSMTNTYNQYGAMQVNISGGSFTSDHAMALYKQEGTYTNDATYAVSGGIFNTPVPEEFCAEGYVPTSITTQGFTQYTVESGVFVAQIGETKYTTLAAAVAAVPTNGTETTITLLKDITLTNNVVVGGTFDGTNNSNAKKVTSVTNQNVILNLDGHTITGTKTLYLAGGSLNITGTGSIISTSQDVAPVGVRYVKTADYPDLDYTSKRTLTIGKNVTLTGAQYGLNIFGTNEASTANNIDVTVDGTVNGMLFVLGNLSNANNNIVINVSGTVDASQATGSEKVKTGIALCGNASVHIIDGAVVKGESGIEVRAGELIMDGDVGGTITATSADYSYTTNGSGTTVKGAAIAVAQHGTKIATSATILGGTLTGAKKIAVIDAQTNSLAGVTVIADDDFLTNSATETVLPDGYYWLSNGDGTSSPAPNSYVAQIGNTLYATLEAAVAAVQDGETIKLLDDISLTDRLFVNAGATPAYAGTDNRYATTTENKSFTLDLNGHNITSSSNIALAGGSLNITNTGDADATHGVISSTNAGLAPIEVRGTGDLTQKRTLTVGTGVTLTGAEYGLNVFGSNDAQKNLIDVNVDGTVNGILFVLGNLSNADNAINVVVNGTVDASNAETGTKPKTGIALNGNANVTVNNGASVTGETGIEVRAGNLTVNGGTITATSADYSYTANGSGTTTKGAAIAVAQHTTTKPINVQLNGGTLTGTELIAVTDVNNNDLEGVSVTAKASFVENTDTKLPDGFIWVNNENGTYYIGVAPVQIIHVDNSIDSYATLAEAFNNVEDIETIKLIADVALTEDVTLDKPFNLDFNNHTINLNGHTIKLVQGETIKTNKQTNIFTAADNNYIITVEDSDDPDFPYAYSEKININTANFTVTVTPVTYDGLNHKIGGQNPVTVKIYDVSGEHELNSNNFEITMLPWDSYDAADFNNREEDVYKDAYTYINAITIKGKPEAGYAGSITVDFVIYPRDINDVTVEGQCQPYTETGYTADDNATTGIKKLVTLKYNNIPLVASTTNTIGDYTIDVDATNTYKDTGTYPEAITLTAVEGGNFTGTRKVDFVIGGDKDIAISNITATVVYTGSRQEPTGAGTTPTVIVKDGLTNAVLAQGTDYELEFIEYDESNNYIDYINAKTYTNAVTIRGIGDYYNTKTVDYIITPKNIADCNIIASTTFTGSVINPADAVQVSDPGLPADPPGNQLLAKGTHYTLTVSNGYTYLNPQTYANAITVTGTGNYTGTVTMDFTITNDNGAIDITEAGMVESYVKFTGKNQPPSKGRLIVSVKNPNTGVKETLVYNQDYTFTFNGVPADYYDAKTYSHAVTITGIGNYYGSFTADYVISPRELTERYIVCEAVDPLVWTGTELKLNVNNQISGRTDNNVILKLVNTEADPANNIPEDAYMLSSASDYTYTTEPVTMKDPGEYVVTFTGRYNFTGKRTVTVKVIKDIELLADDDIEIPIQILGSVTPNIRPSNIQDMVVTDGDNVLEQGTHYTLTFTDGTTTYQGGAGPYITQQGKYTAIITGKDPYYSGEKRKDFVVVNEYYTYNAQETGEEFAVHITSGKNLTATVGAKTGAAIATDGTSLTLPSTIDVTVPNASPETFTLNGIENGAFAGCDKLRYIDATAMSGYVPETLTRDFDGPFGGLPKQALVYLTGTNIKGENYVYKPGSGDAHYCELFKIYDDLNGSQTGFDGNDYKWAFENVHKFTAYTVENTRILTAGKHYTTCLPYSIDIPRNVKAYTLDATSGQIFGFKEVETGTIEAYKPYVLIPSTSGQLLSATDVEVDVFPADATTDATKLNGVNPANSNFTFYGTMRYMEGADAAGKYIMQYKDNKSTWLSIDEGTAGFNESNRACILPMRAYIASTTGGARSFTATFTDIDGIIRTETFTLDDEDTVIYDLSGRRVELLEHGHTYIINGKKVIVK